MALCLNEIMTNFHDLSNLVVVTYCICLGLGFINYYYIIRNHIYSFNGAHVHSLHHDGHDDGHDDDDDEI